MKSATIHLLLLLSSTLAACAGAGNGRPSEAGDTMGMTTAARTQVSSIAQGTVSVAVQGVMEADTTHLTDAQVAGVLSVADSAEIKPSQIALQRAQNAQLRAFAERMVTDHGMLEDSLRGMLRISRLTPEPSPLAMQIQAEAARALSTLERQSGADFDLEYARAMVQSHELALNTIETRLLPDVQSPALRAALNHAVRPTVQAHLASIRAILAAMGGR